VLGVKRKWSGIHQWLALLPVLFLLFRDYEIVDNAENAGSEVRPHFSDRQITGIVNCAFQDDVAIPNDDCDHPLPAGRCAS
jgi:hypothetical protein